MAGRPPFSDCLRDTLNSVLRRNASSGALRAESRGVKVVEPHARHVDVLGENTWVYAKADWSDFAVWSPCWKPPPSATPPKGPGNKLRVIHLAEAEEYLIFLA